MFYATHYEPEEFLTLVEEKKLDLFARVYVLNCGIAGVVYMAKEEGNLYYLDRLLPTDQKLKEFEELDMYEVHQELYAKINLDQRNRERYGIQ